MFILFDKKDKNKIELNMINPKITIKGMYELYEFEICKNEK